MCLISTNTHITMNVLITTLTLKLVVVLRYEVKCADPSQRANVGRMKQLVLHCGMEPRK